MTELNSFQNTLPVLGASFPSAEAMSVSSALSIFPDLEEIPLGTLLVYSAHAV